MKEEKISTGGNILPSDVSLFMLSISRNKISIKNMANVFLLVLQIYRYQPIFFYYVLFAFAILLYTICAILRKKMKEKMMMIMVPS